MWYFNLNNPDAKSTYYRILILLAIILLYIQEYYYKLRLLFTYLVVKFLRIVKCVCRRSLFCESTTDGCKFKENRSALLTQQTIGLEKTY